MDRVTGSHNVNPKCYPPLSTPSDGHAVQSLSWLVAGLGTISLIAELHTTPRGPVLDLFRELHHVRKQDQD